MPEFVPDELWDAERRWEDTVGVTHVEASAYTASDLAIVCPNCGAVAGERCTFQVQALRDGKPVTETRFRHHPCIRRQTAGKGRPA